MPVEAFNLCCSEDDFGATATLRAGPAGFGLVSEVLIQWILPLCLAPWGELFGCLFSFCPWMLTLELPFMATGPASCHLQGLHRKQFPRLDLASQTPCYLGRVETFGYSSLKIVVSAHGRPALSVA